MKYLIWVLLAIAVYLWLTRGRKAHGPRAAHAAKAPQAPAGTEAMMRCAHCGTYVPASEAVSISGTWFCSEEHRALHGASSPRA